MSTFPQFPTFCGREPANVTVVHRRAVERCVAPGIVDGLKCSASLDRTRYQFDQAFEFLIAHKILWVIGR